MTFERDNIARMAGYASGEQPKDDDVIKLNTNENPYPPSPRVQQIIEQFAASALRRYPPPTADGFRDRVAALHGVVRDNIIATRGGDELLRLLITTFVEPGQPIGMTEPTYSLYPVLAEIQDCPVFKVPLGDDWSHAPDMAERVNQAGCPLTFVVNPHAPSGRLHNVQELDALAGAFNGLLVIDEAYVDFTDGTYDAVPLIRSHDNVVILRTLSKGYSLAGLRFGYGIGPASLIEPMVTKTRDSYNLDTFSQQIAEAAVDDQAYAQETWENVRRERSRLASELAQLGLTAPPSDTNFLLVTIPPSSGIGARDVYLKLKDERILVRYFDAERLHDKLRVSVGTPAENDALLKSLKSILGSAN